MALRVEAVAERDAKGLHEPRLAPRVVSEPVPPVEHVPAPPVAALAHELQNPPPPAQALRKPAERLEGDALARRRSRWS